MQESPFVAAVGGTMHAFDQGKDSIKFAKSLNLSADPSDAGSWEEIRENDQTSG